MVNAQSLHKVLVALKKVTLAIKKILSEIETLFKDSLFDFVNRRSEKAFLDGKLDIPCLRIWRNALPIGRNARDGLLVPEA